MNRRQAKKKFEHKAKKVKEKQIAIMKFIELKHKYENLYHFYLWSEWLKGEENGN